MLDFQASRWLNKGEVPRQAGNNHPTHIPTGVFRTADGFINIGASGQKMWERLCDAIGARELVDDPRFIAGNARSDNRDALTLEIEKHLAPDGSVTWIDRLNDAGVPCGRIYSIDEVFADPQVQSLDMVKSVASPHYQPLRLMGQAVRLSRTPSEITTRPPESGEHTAEILASLGYSAEEIAELRRRDIA
jgi:crotonobetainyl-CoA:carnitine CoA-transferase CaiB-like acyl-CoA transferase